MNNTDTGGHALGETIERLFAVIETRKGASPDSSYTARLLAGGPLKCAKKMGEEAVEVALAAVGEDEKALANEAADLVYHLLVVMAARRVSPRDVARALQSRENQSGLEEKASRQT